MHTTHLLDTNICSYLMRRKPPSVVERLEALGPERVAVSVITAIELRTGADLANQPSKYHALLDVFLGEILVLPLDERVVRVTAGIPAQLRSSRQADRRARCPDRGPRSGAAPHGCHPQHPRIRARAGARGRGLGLISIRPTHCSRARASGGGSGRLAPTIPCSSSRDLAAVHPVSLSRLATTARNAHSAIARISSSVRSCTGWGT